jgi:membrane associated rhomboid family serine protease
MIPLIDNFPRKRFPGFTFGLCSFMVIVWALQPPINVFLASPLDQFYHTFALSRRALLFGEYYRIVTHMFLHGHLIHLLFNVWGLWFFGSRLEEKWGGPKVLGTFLLSGVAGGVLLCLYQIVTGNLGLGASAGVFGLMTVYLLRRSEHALVGIAIVVPVALTGWEWFALVVTLNLMGAIASISGIAFGAHLAGMFVGFVIDVFRGFSLRKTVRRTLSLFSGSLEGENRRLAAYLKTP